MIIAMVNIDLNEDIGYKKLIFDLCKNNYGVSNILKVKFGRKFLMTHGQFH